MFVPGVPIIITDTEPTIPSPSGFDSSDWKWFNTSNQRWYDYEGAWVIQGEEPPEYVTTDEEGNVTPENIQIKNLNITGNLWCEGDNGANAEVTVGGFHMVVKEGIVTTLEAV